MGNGSLQSIFLWICVSYVVSMTIFYWKLKMANYRKHRKISLWQWLDNKNRLYLVVSVVRFQSTTNHYLPLVIHTSFDITPLRIRINFFLDMDLVNSKIKKWVFFRLFRYHTHWSSVGNSNYMWNNNRFIHNFYWQNLGKNMTFVTNY